MAAPIQEASLKTIFMQKNDGFKFKIKVKILKAISSTDFLVADSTGSCKLKIDNLKPIYMGSFKENNFVKIFNVKTNIIEKHIIVDCTSKVFLIGRFEIDLKKWVFNTEAHPLPIYPN